MPKHYSKKGSYRKTVMNKSAPTVRKPYGGRSNNDCFVKIEQCVELKVAPAV